MLNQKNNHHQELIDVEMYRVFFLFEKQILSSSS